jgi:hypothetical protein
VPNDRPGGWRPYTCGHWVASDQGWVWVSEDQDAQFGEVCYHYGRWYEDPSVGWCWVPGSVWGPSWCAWREGGGYCAWAPLPPQCVDGSVVNVTVVNQYVPADRYYVVEEQYISEPRLDRRITYNNVTIINRTKNITNITYVDNRAVNHGVLVRNVEHALGHPVRRVQVSRVDSIEEARSLVASGRPAIYSPPEVAHYGQEHPVKAFQPRRVPASHAEKPHVDQNTAEQLRVDQQHHGATDNPLEQRTPEKSQAERDADAQRLRGQDQHVNQHVNENVTHEQRPQVDQTVSEDARLRALQEQKAAQDAAAADKAAAERAARDKQLQDKAAEDRAARDAQLQEKAAAERAARDKQLQDKAAEDRAARDRAAEEKAAAEKAAMDRDKAQRDAQAEQLRNEKLAEQRAAQEKAAEEKAAAEKAAQQRALDDKAARDRAAADKAARDKAAQNKNGQKPGDPNNPNNAGSGPRY